MYTSFVLAKERGRCISSVYLQGLGAWTSSMNFVELLEGDAKRNDSSENEGFISILKLTPRNES